jgi:hypothetical protein
MRARKLNKELNPVSIIDELIMELSYIKNGSTPSSEKLQKGIELIEHLISLSDESHEEVVEDKLGFSPFQDKKYFYSGKYNIKEHKNKLEKAKEIIKKFIVKPAVFDKNDIENIQELLLKISLPIWKEQVSILKPNQFKLIEL